MDFEDELIVFGDFVKGTCELMCPENERKMRERERLVHPLERQPVSALRGDDHSCPIQGMKQSKKHQNHIADPSRTIKAFSRSAAGHKMPQPADLRPFPVLDMTVVYLIENIACNDIEAPGWVDRYNFVTDRLRAVRQDMVIQSLPPNECVKLLVPMVKFHIFAGYWLSENPVGVFDPKINNSFLQECVKRVLVMYDVLRNNEIESILRNSDENLHENSRNCNSSEHLMGALYLLINLGSSQALNHGILRIVNARRNCKSCPQRKAYEISLAALMGNYVRVCHLSRKLSTILCMAVAPHLPYIRRHTLMVMSTAYSNKATKFPLKVLQDILMWNNEQEVINECKYYGLTVEKSQNSDPEIQFQKGEFNQYVKMAQPLRLSWMDETLTSSSVLQILGKH